MSPVPARRQHRKERGMKVKHEPMRRCIGCMESKPKKECLRICRTPEGLLKLDPTGKLNGRGAYICRSGQCLAAARKANRLAKAFECAVPPEVYDRLAEEIGNG